MADLRLGILIEGEADFHKADAGATAYLSKFEKAHSNTLKAAGQHYDQYRAGALNNIKTVEQYREEWSNKSTKSLVLNIKKIQDARVDEQRDIAKAAAEADTVSLRRHKNELERLTLESRALKQVSIERSAVQSQGLGGIIGQMGTGRSLFNAGNLETLKGVGMQAGQSALGGGMLTSSLAAVGPVGLAAAAAIGALSFGLKKAIDVGAEFEDKMAELSAITGVSGGVLTNLGEKARKLGVEFGEGASSGVEAFKLVISALGPSIANNAEALNTMGRDVMTLAKAAGVDAPQATAVLTNTLMQFGGANLTAAQQAEQTTRIMNVMAAGAKEGAAEIPDLSEAIKIVGTVAAQSKVSIEQTTAAIEVMSQQGLRGQEAGTGFRNVLLELSAGGKKAQGALKDLGLTYEDVNPAKVGLDVSLERMRVAFSNVGDEVRSARDKQLLFGKENIASANILMQNAGAIRDMTKAVTGTNEATDQAAKRQNTFNESMKRASAEFADMGISVFQIIQPALTKVSDLFGVVAHILHDTLPTAFHIAIAPIEFIYKVIAKLVDWTGLAIGKFYDWITSFTAVRLIIFEVRTRIEDFVNWIEAAYKTTMNFIHGITSTIDKILGKKQVVIPVVIKPEVSADPLAPPPITGDGGADDEKKDKDAYTAEKTRLDNIHGQRKLDLLKRLQTDLETEDSYKHKELELEVQHQQELVDLSHEHQKGHRDDVLSSETALVNAQMAIRKLDTEDTKKATKIKTDEYKKELAEWQGKLQGILHALGIQTTAEEEHAKKRLEIRQRLEDWEAQLIENKTDRETAQENLRYLRMKENIGREFTLKADYLKATELLEKEHADKLREIQDKSSADIKAVSQSGIQSVLTQVNEQFSKTLSLGQQSGNVVVNAFRAMATEGLNLLKQHILEKIAGLLANKSGGGASSDKEPKEVSGIIGGGASALSSIFGGLGSKTPGFGDIGGGQKKNGILDWIAALPSREVGGETGKGGLFKLHPNELVLNSEEAESYRQLLGVGGNKGRGNSSLFESFGQITVPKLPGSTDATSASGALASGREHKSLLAWSSTPEGQKAKRLSQYEDQKQEEAAKSFGLTVEEYKASQEKIRDNVKELITMPPKMGAELIGGEVAGTALMSTKLASAAAHNSSEIFETLGGMFGEHGARIGSQLGHAGVHHIASSLGEHAANSLVESAEGEKTEDNTKATEKLTQTLEKVAQPKSLKGGAPKSGDILGMASPLLGMIPGLGSFLPALGPLLSGFGLADGTDDWMGGPVKVGEHGSEIVNLPRHARVVPHGQSGGVGMDTDKIVAAITAIPRTTILDQDRQRLSANRSLRDERRTAL